MSSPRHEHSDVGWTTDRWTGGGQTDGKTCFSGSQPTLCQRGWSRADGLASLATASSGPVCGSQPLLPGRSLRGPGLLRSRCSFLSLAESRVGTVQVRSAGSRCEEREEASPPDLGSLGPHREHRARLHWQRFCQQQLGAEQIAEKPGAETGE